MKMPVAFLLFLFAFTYSVSGQDDRFLFKGLPAINIILLDNKAEYDITKDVKLNATMSVSNAYGSTFTALQLFTGNITIKGRGNYTWTLSKRPYSIITCDAAFKKKSVPLFGFPTQSAWCLLADYEDRTYVKTQFSSALSYSLGLPWASRALKVELYINGEYRGLYTFCEKVERDISRINVTELKTSDNSGDALTGGYAIERQDPGQLGVGEVYFQDIQGRYWSYKVPDSDKPTPQQNSYIQGYYNSFLDKVYNKPFGDTINGYRSVIYPVSFAQYYLLEDISGNGDQNSWYITKDRLKKMEGGPGWDFGLAWGSVTSLSDPSLAFTTSITPYYGKMLEDSFFSNLVKQTFIGARTKMNQIVSDAEVYFPQIVATGAISRDSTRWPDFAPGFWNTFPTYKETTNFFLSYVKQRIYHRTRMVYGVMPGKPTHVDIL